MILPYLRVLSYIHGSRSHVIRGLKSIVPVKGSAQVLELTLVASSTEVFKARNQIYIHGLSARMTPLRSTIGAFVAAVSG
jgi:hypothetical protein